MPKIRKSSIVLTVIFATVVFFVGCSQQLGPDSGCAPNVIDSGLQLQVSDIGANAFGFTLCANANPPNNVPPVVYSVYGGLSTSALSSGNINTANVRGAHISGSIASGSVFQITFFGSDTAFAVYQDKIDSFGNPQLDFTYLMVSPHTLPGR